MGELDMPKLDYSIYGCDDQAFANSISGDALGSPSPNTAISADAISHGSEGKRLDGTEDKTPLAKEPNPPYMKKGIEGGKAESKGNR
jgi:hypothetical protein